MDDLISRQAAIDEVHHAVFEFFDICEDDDESPITEKDKMLLSLNKAISSRIKQLPSAQRKGKWHAIGNTGLASCECGFTTNRFVGQLAYRFCPNCGVEMEEEDKDISIECSETKEK